ncbi:isochorismate synthase [Gordonia sp. ABSL1-1]|uniref:isochorismate synthase n=1 Tax=Gordonia sp. ABSL1-1 TaxID=3053923 RepID=UPI002572D670|nr:isochorismate synthase [Gordonia sp. ABSL1-1]MDL9938586.1 isochorismate synthase [Gordonia sp. ABSL1-1]
MTTSASADPVVHDAEPLDDVFVLSRPHGTVRARGVEQIFTDVHAAAAALRGGRVAGLTGAIGFDAESTAALVAPTAMSVSQLPIDGEAPRTHTVTAAALVPDVTEHRSRVGHTIERIRGGEVDKVVLARRVDLTVEPAVSPAHLVESLAGGNSERNAFAVNLGAVTGSGSWLLGASPELLLRKQGDEVTCRPYAGSAPRSTDPDVDRATAEALRGSAKDHAEHAFVIDFLTERLTRICDDVEVPAEPEVLATGEVWHLATPIKARLCDPKMTALDLALLLGPTPAVCGSPTEAAAEIIAEVEGDRGFYAGAVGWCDGNGDGEWMVTIRCLELAADGHHLRTWAGGGIVADSDPQAEVDETSVKLRTVLNALGVDSLD